MIWRVVWQVLVEVQLIKSCKFPANPLKCGGSGLTLKSMRKGPTGVL